MTEFACGRVAMCNECTDIALGGRARVCEAVGYIAGIEQPEDLSYQEMHDITYSKMLAEAGDTERVSMEMRMAAAESAYDLIVNNK